MRASRWNAILLRIVRQDADDLDEIAGAFDPLRRSTGRDLFPQMDADLMPLAPLRRTDAVCIGLRPRVEGPDIVDQAMRVAAFALERDVEVVALESGAPSGLERFGFRAESVVGETDAQRAACEDQIRRFWNIDMVM